MFFGICGYFTAKRLIYLAFSAILRYGSQRIWHFNLFTAAEANEFGISTSSQLRRPTNLAFQPLYSCGGLQISHFSLFTAAESYKFHISASSQLRRATNSTVQPLHGEEELSRTLQATGRPSGVGKGYASKRKCL
ncbi:hypothetical protein CLV25_10374 [Acetobacteroides hydrogenigenes]|uniref:Uncharacterized protein n=1 Tax=Acetobacteroides hydrogenigenes TaxID=979970 RepID=A0A4R2F0Q7_9BACT|nr:hypothetical protein CLV25_10374 [Acetobacteroides hydrogenigenes]